MLRCPKCSRIYHDASQLFCINDGGRLMRADDLNVVAEQTAADTITRRTAPGELVAETFVTGALEMNPSIAAQFAANDDKTRHEIDADENGNADSASSPRFESFGIHSANPSQSTAIVAFSNSSAVESQALELLRDNSNESRKANRGNFLDSIGGYKTDSAEIRDEPKHSLLHSDYPFLAGCLFMGLITLTGLVLISAYFFQGQQEPAAQVAAFSSGGANPEMILPSNYVTFENFKDNLDGVLAQKFVKFSVGYPNDWVVNPKEGTKGAANYLDVAKFDASGLPNEQLLVSWYDSRGTFAADASIFPILARKIGERYANRETGIPDYQKVSEGAIRVNGKDAYELRFEGRAVDNNNKTYNIWGRTIFMPAEREGATSGLILTMLATSRSANIRRAEDVGRTGDLSKILTTLQIRD